MSPFGADAGTTLQWPRQRCHICGRAERRGGDTQPCMKPFSSLPRLLLLLSPPVLPTPACVRDGRCLLAGCQVTALIERSPESRRYLNPPLSFPPSLTQTSALTGFTRLLFLFSPLLPFHQRLPARFFISRLHFFSACQLFLLPSPDIPSVSGFYQTLSMAGNPYPITQLVPHPQNRKIHPLACKRPTQEEERQRDTSRQQLLVSSAASPDGEKERSPFRLLPPGPSASLSLSLLHQLLCRLPLIFCASAPSLRPLLAASSSSVFFAFHPPLTFADSNSAHGKSRCSPLEPTPSNAT